jgi:hypothetical protein
MNGRRKGAAWFCRNETVRGCVPLSVPPLVESKAPDISAGGSLKGSDDGDKPPDDILPDLRAGRKDETL